MSSSDMDNIQRTSMAESLKARSTRDLESLCQRFSKTVHEFNEIPMHENDIKRLKEQKVGSSEKMVVDFIGAHASLDARSIPGRGFRLMMCTTTKTERYVQHRERVVPLFPELRAELEKHFFIKRDEGERICIPTFSEDEWAVETPF